MPTEPVPQSPICGVPGCPRPRLTEELCDCEEEDCERRHIRSECCKRHSSNCAGNLWLRNDGIIDRQAIDIVIHDERVVPLTWTEALIVVSTLLALGYSMNETTRRLGFDASIYRHGVLRGYLVKHDLRRAVAYINGEPLPPMPEIKERDPGAPRKRIYSEMTPEQQERDREVRRLRQRRAYQRMTPEQRTALNAVKAERERARRARKQEAAS